MHREMGQPSLASLLPETLGHSERLERIAEAFDWDRFGRVLARVHSALEGRPSYPSLMMVKVLLLEQWYNLSDPQMEEALQDRISFRRFVGLGLQDDTPDYSDDQPPLEELGISETLFKELEAQLDERGLVLLMDATLVKAHVRRRVRPIPMRTGPRPTVGGGPTATRCIWVWTPAGLVRKAALTPAKVYESEVADGPVMSGRLRGPRL